jgi:hypothetical protein
MPWPQAGKDGSGRPPERQPAKPSQSEAWQNKGKKGKTMQNQEKQGKTKQSHFIEMNCLKEDELSERKGG